MLSNVLQNDIYNQFKDHFIIRFFPNSFETCEDMKRDNALRICVKYLNANFGMNGGHFEFWGICCDC